jgi:hypothetical protein
MMIFTDEAWFHLGKYKCFRVKLFMYATNLASKLRIAAGCCKGDFDAKFILTFTKKYSFQKY